MNKYEFLKEFNDTRDSYQPNDNVKKQLKEITFVPVIGPSGVGKSSVIKASGLHLVVSDMTRAPRSGEKEGEDAYFRTDFGKLLDEYRAGEFVQVASGPTGEFYASRASAYPKDGPALMPTVAKALKEIRMLGFSKVLPVFVVPPSFEEWQSRLGKHGESLSDFKLRLNEAKESFDTCLQDSEVTFLVNDKLSQTVKLLQDLVGGSITEDAKQFEEAKIVAKQIREKLTELFA